MIKKHGFGGLYLCANNFKHIIDESMNIIIQF